MTGVSPLVRWSFGPSVRHPSVLQSVNFVKFSKHKSPVRDLISQAIRLTDRQMPDDGCQSVGPSPNVRRLLSIVCCPPSGLDEPNLRTCGLTDRQMPDDGWRTADDRQQTMDNGRWTMDDG